MGAIILRDYQQDGVDGVAKFAGQRVRRILFQGPTGSGKTVIFSELTQRFQAKIPSRVIIAVHRMELLMQTIEALKNVAGINAGMLIAGCKVVCQDVGEGIYIPHTQAKVVVCMIETLHNRLKRYDNFLGDVGMLIVDEAHRGEFTKIYERFPATLIVGFTATPISAKKKIPLKTHFDDIVVPCTIQKLIDQGHLAKNITITVKNGVDRKKLKSRMGDFDERVMAMLYSNNRHVENTVKAYKKYSLGLKTVVFNCNVAHSQLVTDAFVEQGFNARHLDGSMSSEVRAETLDWLKNTHDAILCSVDLLTTGFDEPTLQTVIVNRATMSLVLWLQMCGRGSRTVPGKTTFNIIDLGQNVASHLDWNYPHNWKMLFLHPEQVGNGKGVAPTKLCPECEAMIHLSTVICPFCLSNIAKDIEYDKNELDLEVLTKGVDIEAIIARNAQYKPYRALHIAKSKLVQRFRMQYKHHTLTQEIRDLINDRYQVIVKDWCLANANEKNKISYNRWHKNITKKWMMDELNRIYGKLEVEQAISA